MEENKAKSKTIIEENERQFATDGNVVVRGQNPQNITLPDIVPFQAEEKIQTTPISKNTAIISKTISDVMTGEVIDKKGKEEWQQKSDEKLLDIGIFIDEHGEIHHTLNLPMRKIIHALSMMCFNEQENRNDKTAHALLTKYTQKKANVYELERRSEAVGKYTDFGCIDLLSLSELKPKLTRQVITAFRPVWESIDGFGDFEALDYEKKRQLFSFFNNDLHLVKFTMSELIGDYLGTTKGRNYKEYQKAFADVINIFYSAYNPDTQTYEPHRLIRDVHAFIDGKSKVYYIDLSPLFYKGIVRQWKMYPPIEIDRQIVSQANEPTMKLYEYIIANMRTNWNGTITFGALAEMLVPDDVKKGLQPIRIKEKIFAAFQVLTDNKLLLSNPIQPLMERKERKAETINQIEIRIEPNKDIFKIDFGG